MSHDHPHAATTPPEEWQSRLRAKGYRLTPQRELVLRAVDRLGHATPDEILSAVREESQAVNVSTVYRTLQTLADGGEVDMLRTEEGEAIYRRCSLTHHHHLVCRSCGRTVEVEGPTVERWSSSVAAKHGFTDVSHTLEIFGTCPSCR